MIRHHARRTAARTATIFTAGLGLVLAAATSAGATTPSAAAAGQQFFVMDWNMAGATTHDGDASEPNNYGTNTVADRLADLAQTWHPAVISVNEVCDSQVSHLRSALADRGMTVTAWQFTPTGSAHPACLLHGGTYAGLAVLSTVPAGSGASLWFDDSTNQVVTSKTSRGVACLTLHLTRDVRACSMHLAQDQSAAVAQATAFTTTYRSQIEAAPWMLLGDFNATPDQLLTPLYDPSAGGAGDFYETDMDGTNLGQATEGSRKIDYVFAGSNAFDRGALGTAVLDPGTCKVPNVIQPPPFVKYPHPCSDHRPIVGAVTLLP
jgi:endonuclease/exonuclease/phosphatase family metal-dependent hydrolase